MKVNLFCIGAQKAGTTTLYEILIKHPDISFSRAKELHFFNTKRYKKCIDYYHSLFNDRKAKYFADFTPGYMIDPKVSQRLFRYNPNAKIIAILRHPVDRAFSNYQMHQRNGKEKRTFKSSILAEIEAIKLKNSVLNYDGYVMRGLYSKQLKYFLDLFDHHNIKIILFEDLINKQKETIAEVYAFLEVEEIEYTQPTIANENYKPRFRLIHDAFYKIPNLTRIRIKAYIPRCIKNSINKLIKVKTERKTVPLDAKAILMEFYQEEFDDLEKLIKRDLSTWKEK